MHLCRGLDYSDVPSTSCLIPQLGETLNRQFESVCETMFGEVESQAVEALDLPGVFRTRSHSYVRAIQAGCSQDDDCLSVFSMSGPQGSIKGGAGECVWLCGALLQGCVLVFYLVATWWETKSGSQWERGNFMTACDSLPRLKQVSIPTHKHTVNLHKALLYTSVTAAPASKHIRF